MNAFAINSPLKDHVFIRMFSVQNVVHMVYSVADHEYSLSMAR